MSSIRYPSLDEFWPAVRARRFVQALGGKATKYVENMAFLAERAGVHPAQMDKINPLTFAERNGLLCSVRKMLGERTYVELDRWRNSTWHHSVTWAYAMNEPIPPYVPSAPPSASAPTPAPVEPPPVPVSSPPLQLQAEMREDAWACASTAAVKAKTKRSWWRHPWICGMAAVEPY